jgi:hypothetical protein
VTGVDPVNLTRVRQDVGEPCTSKRSVASTALGVSYRGTSGIYLIGFEGSENATKNYLPASTFLNSADTVTEFWGNKMVWIDASTRTGYIFDPVRAEKGLTTFALDFDVYDLHVSPVDGQLWASYTDAGVPKRAPLFKIVANPARFTYYTQHILLPKPISMGALQVDWDWATQSATMKEREDVIITNKRLRAGGFAAINDHAINGVAINGDELQALYSPNTTVPTERYLKVTVIANPDSADDRTVVFDDFVVDDEPVRMSGGIKSNVFQLQFVGNAKVTAATIADTVEELKQD